MSFLQRKNKDEKKKETGTEGKVLLNKKVYRTIVASSVRFANPRIPEPEWLEIYGILIGHNEGNNVIVSAAYPMTHTMNKGIVPKVSYESPDYPLAAAIEEEAYTHDPPEFIVGWYHTHPGMKIMFSQDDIKNQSGFQTNNPLAIGPVFDPIRLLKQINIDSKNTVHTPLVNDPGFKIFRLVDPTKIMEASYVEVPFELIDGEFSAEFIKEIQDFANDCARLFPQKDIINKNKEKFIKQLEKTKELAVGTEAYIETLKKSNEASRIPEVIANQKKELDKLIEPIEKDVKLLQEIIEYVELKERDDLIPAMKDLIDWWHNEAAKYITMFQMLKTKN